MAALTNYHEFGAFNNTNLFVYSSRGCKSEVLFIKPKPGCWKGCVKRETLGKNPFPGPFQPLELHSWDYGHSVLQTQHLQTSSPPITISPPAFCVKSPIASRLWGHFWLHLGPTGLIHDNLPISKILKLITSTKSRLPYEVSFRVQGSEHRFLWEPLFSLPPQLGTIQFLCLFKRFSMICPNNTSFGRKKWEGMAYSSHCIISKGISCPLAP